VTLPTREEVVRATLAAAESEWERGVRDQAGHHGMARIDLYIRDGHGLGWTWERPYVGNGQYQWCGAFVAWCMAAAGLLPRLRRDCWSSTTRLDAYGRYGVLQGVTMPTRVRLPGGKVLDVRTWHESLGAELRRWQAPQPGRDLAWEPAPGDIALVGTRGCGQHVALVRQVDLARGILLTTEGNATGLGPGGARFEGVVHHERPLPTRGNSATYHVRTIIRPARADFVAGVELL